VHRIGTSDADQIGWSEVTTLSNALIALGNTSTAITAVTETGPVEITALEWQSILIAAGQFRQPIWAASFVLQAMGPDPGGFRGRSILGIARHQVPGAVTRSGDGPTSPEDPSTAI
jgi:hypothetical protein